MEAVVALFNLLSRHIRGETEDNHANMGQDSL
jgi:hypothetical protein